MFADDELHHDGPYTGGGLFSLLPSPTGQQVRGLFTAALTACAGSGQHAIHGILL